MPRDVSIRQSYSNDVAYLTRLIRAIEKDPRMKGCAGECRKSINQLIVRMLNAEGAKG